MTRIHLPLSNGALVNVGVTEGKRYGEFTGKELITRYSKRPRQIIKKTNDIKIIIM